MRIPREDLRTVLHSVIAFAAAALILAGMALIGTVAALMISAVMDALGA